MIARVSATALCLMLASVPAYSDSHCPKNVTAVGVGDKGTLFAWLNTGPVYMCNVSTTAGTFSATTCQGIQSLMTAALLSGRQINVWLHTDNCPADNIWREKNLMDSDFSWYAITVH
jgi:hypothetical protein